MVQIQLCERILMNRGPFVDSVNASYERSSFVDSVNASEKCSSSVGVNRDVINPGWAKMTLLGGREAHAGEPSRVVIKLLLPFAPFPAHYSSTYLPISSPPRSLCFSRFPLSISRLFHYCCCIESNRSGIFEL